MRQSNESEISVHVCAARLLILLAVAVPLATPSAEPVCLADTTNRVIGGLEPDRWLILAREAADALLEAAPDRYGKEHTPLWVGVIDPEKRRLIDEKPENFMRYWDAEDYVMTAQGCNLYRDLPALSALCELSELTGDSKYREAADAYLEFYLRECPSETTGLLPTGEHMSYNCVRDRIIATRHEMEHSLPDWDLLWRVNPEAVERAIEAIHECHIYDKEQFFYDRHGAYYTGDFDPMPVRGTYIKHSGLYAYSFLFLHSKTRDAEHLKWAHGIADLYWRHRDPRTSLVPGYVSPGGAQGTTRTQLLLAYYLLEATRFETDPFFVERGLGMVDSYLKYGFDSDRSEFAQSLDIKTGDVAIPPAETPWTGGESGSFYELMAVWKAYELTGKQEYLDIVCARLHRVAEAPLAEDMDPYTAAKWLELFVSAFEATRDRSCLHYARTLADWTASRLVKDGFILESADGCVYHNYHRPGALLKAWLRLHQAEENEAIHWQAPDAVRTTGPAIPVTFRGCGARITWRFKDDSGGEAVMDASGATATVSIPIPDNVAQGPMHLRFAPVEGDAWTADETEILVAENPDGPRFSQWDHPGWVTADATLEGRVDVTDPSGVTRVGCVYFGTDGAERRVPCHLVSPNASTYTFSIPTQDGESDAITFAVEATGNPSWPVTRRSAPRRVIVAKTSAMPEGLGLTRVHAEESWVDTAGLPEMILSAFVQVQPKTGSNVPEGTDLLLEYDAVKALEAWQPSIAAYQWDGTEWAAVSDATLVRTAGSVRVSCQGRGPFVVAGASRLVWRRSFNGALLSSPALARIDSDGTPAIILDTRKPDGMLYALDTQGKTLWTYDVDDEQPYVAVADFDGDGIDEIALGGPKLTLLNCDGSVRWEAALTDAVTPAIGDVDGDGKLDVVSASVAGTVAAFTGDGRELWETAVPEGWRPTPTLGNVDGEGGLDVLFGKKGSYYAFSGTDGTTLWETPVHGDVLNAPAVADLDNDGRDEVVFFTRTDNEGTLYALDDAGAVLWHVPTNRDSDWSPVICDFDGTGELQVIAQEPEPTEFGIYSAHGQRVRTIKTPGRTMQSPIMADFDGDGRLDLFSAFDIAMQVRVYANDGRVLWAYTPESLTMAGAKIKGNGSMLVTDLDGDGWLEAVGGDDLTWLQMFKTDTRCEPWAVVSGQFKGDARHSGYYALKRD